MLSVAFGSRLQGVGIFGDARHRRTFPVLARHAFDEISQRSDPDFVATPSTGSFAAQDSLRARDQSVRLNELVDRATKELNAHETFEIPRGKQGSWTKPMKYVLCDALNACAKSLHWQLGLQIHGRIVRGGYEDNIILNSALVDFYAKCNALDDARRVFDDMRQRDQVSWTSIISGCVQNGHGSEAILLFKKMLACCAKPNCFTYVSVITACRGLEASVEQGRLFHAHVVKLGYGTNSFVICSLIDCYSKCGLVDQAALIFSETANRDIIVCNSMISGYSLNFHCEEALELFVRMRSENLSLTDHTLSIVLNACGSLTVIQQGRRVHCLVVKLGSLCNVFVASALIDMYSKCGSIDEARSIFNQMINKNSILWTSMISGYAQSGRGSEGLKLFDHFLIEEGFELDHICFTVILSACNHAGLLDRGLEYFNKMTKDHGLVPTLDQYACLVDLCARKGHIMKAKQLMEEMPFTPNDVMLSSFLSSCRIYGALDLAREIAEDLFKMRPYNMAAYVTMAHIYAEAGLWDEVAEIRKLMGQNAIIKRAGQSWVESGLKGKSSQ